MAICEFFFSLTWSRVCVWCRNPHPYSSQPRSLAVTCTTPCETLLYEDLPVPGSGRLLFPPEHWLPEQRFLTCPRRKRAPEAKDLDFFFFFPTTVQTLTWKEAELCCDTVFCSECDGTGPAWKWRAEWQGSIWNLDVQSYIYNVDEFKFYFYREDFSPLKLCLEWQNCFYY